MNDNAPLTEAVFYILLSLQSPLHGYGIMQNVEALSNGRVRLAAGTMYGALSNMTTKGWIQLIDGDDNDRKKEYLITHDGSAVLYNEVVRLKEMLNNADKLLGEQSR